MLNIEEIKAKYDEAFSCGDSDRMWDSLSDIPTLIAEVERLTVDKNRLSSDCILHEQTISSQDREIAAKDQQIATQKKALEIASAEANKLFGQLELFGLVKADRKASCIQDNIDVWIQQAQEQEGKK